MDTPEHDCGAAIAMIKWKVSEYENFHEAEE
jgi:hypothetical protein